MCLIKNSTFQFIGSEESILEFPADSTPDTNTSLAPSNINSRPNGALADLIRSRDFVIDFPRVFVLEGATETRRRSAVFSHGIPERSQSTMGFTQAKDWMHTVANKLEEQHGFRRTRKDSQKMEMQENLLSVRQESMKMRRSHSTEGRYCVPKELTELASPDAQALNGEQNVAGACGGQNISNASSTSRRNSISTVINQFQPVTALKFDILNKRRISQTTKRISDESLKACTLKEAEQDLKQLQMEIKEDDVPNIQIEIVDEDN